MNNNFEVQGTNILNSSKPLDDLFFASNNTPTYIESTHKPHVEKPVGTNISEYSLFGPTEINKQIGYKPTTTTVNNFAQLAKLVENPNFFSPSEVTSYDLLDNSPPKSAPQNTTPQPIIQSAPRREVSLFYLKEIALFTVSDVNNATQTRIDNSTGELYGPLPEFKVGAVFSSPNEFCPKLHRDALIEVTKPDNNQAASSILLQRDHDDRGNIVLFKGQSIYGTEQMNEPPLVGESLSLAHNSKFKIPVRVIRREGSMYRYDGLYFVGDYWFEKSADGNDQWNYLFKLVRLSCQPSLSQTKMTMTAPNLVAPQLQPPQLVSYNAEPDHMTQRQSYSQPQYQPQQQYIPPQQQYYNPPQQQYQNYNQMPYAPKPAPTRSPVPRNTNVLGMDLNHIRVREMLSQLKQKNNTFNVRISQYNQNIETLSGKAGIDISGSGEGTVTSRNKGFYWNDANGAPIAGEVDSTRKSLKRKSDDTSNDGGDEGASPSASKSKTKKPSKKRARVAEEEKK